MNSKCKCKHFTRHESLDSILGVYKGREIIGTCTKPQGLVEEKIHDFQRVYATSDCDKYHLGIVKKFPCSKEFLPWI